MDQGQAAKLFHVTLCYVINPPDINNNDHFNPYALGNFVFLIALFGFVVSLCGLLR